MKPNELFTAMQTVSTYEYERIATHESSIISTLYELYIGSDPIYMTQKDRELEETSAVAAKQAESGTIDAELLCDLEGAANQAGFWAGFLAGQAYSQFLRKRAMAGESA